MDELSRAILLLLAEGKCCEDVLRARPDLTRAHVMAAAREALRVAEEGERRADRIARVRRTHPHAFEPWTEIEDRLLVQRFRDGASIAGIARALGRPPGAIRTRLERLGHDPRRSAIRDAPPPDAPRRAPDFEWQGGP